MVGKNFKQLRTIALISQLEMAEKIGVNQSTVAKYENGNLVIPKDKEVLFMKEIAGAGIGATELELLNIVNQAKGRGK